MVERYIKVVCDNCNAEKSFVNTRIFDIYALIRLNSWAISKDKKIVFCPNCKTIFKNTGRNGAEKSAPFYRKKNRYMEKMARIDDEIRREEVEMHRRIDEELARKYNVEDN